MKLSTITTGQLFKELKTSPDGLSVVEVEKRLKTYGENKLPSKPKKSSLVIFLHQFKSPLVYILLIAAVISAITHDVGDSVIILFVLLINAAVGYYQELKAENTLYKLRQILPQEALVKRGGDLKKVVAEKLVPGDVILLKAGDKVVADVKVISAVDLSVNEAFLTGESRPVKKTPLTKKARAGDDTTSIVYAGSIIQYGEGEGVVVSTGLATKLGNIAQLVSQTVDTETPLQRRIRNLANKLVIVLLLVTILIFALGIAAGHSYIEMTGIAVALAVSAIPEGLLIAITVILAIGMQRILKQQALVKQLLAAETLGSASVICTDKTGTLTEGAMKVTRVITLDDEYKISQIRKGKTRALHRLIDVAVYCNDAVIENYQLAKEQWQLIGRPTDRSLLQFTLDVSTAINNKRKALPRTTYIPFDSKVKFMATRNAVDKSSSLLFVKGAPEKIIERSRSVIKGDREIRLSDAQRRALLKKALTLSSEGYRVLAGGYKKERKKSLVLTTDDIHTITFAGFYIIEDPVRPEAATTIKEAKKAGIVTVMITGDHPNTALSIAKQLKLPSDEKYLLTGDDLENMTDAKLTETIESIRVYARVVPEDKMRIVSAWQQAGYIVAMTGDGINDAPALKKANIGIAIGSGTEVAKEAADLILLDDNFKTIVAAIAEGRVIFANVIKSTRIILSGAFSGLLVISTSIIIGIPLPLLAVQILWKNVLTDGLPDVALSGEPPEPNVLEHKPIKQGASILEFQDKFFVIFLSIIMAGSALASFAYTFNGSETLAHARTVAFSVLVFSSLLSVYSIRDLKRPLWKRSLLDNKFLLYSVIAGIVLQLAVVYTPVLQVLFETTSLGYADWVLILSTAIGVMIATEALKGVFTMFYSQK